MPTGSSFLLWQTWPEHPPIMQSLSAAQAPFVEDPQKTVSVGGGCKSGFVGGGCKLGSVGGGPDGAVSLVHAQVRIAAVNRRIMMCFICCYLTFWVYIVTGWLP